VLKILVTAAALLWSGAALADDGPAKPMRLLGDAPTIGEAGPAHFAIDALLSESEEQGETKVDGWFTALPPLVGSGEVTGKCERKHCELSLKLDNGKLTLTGDLGGLSGPAVGAFAVGDDDGPPVTKGAVTFAPFTDTLPGLGELVKPEAVDSAALADMLLWDGAGPAFGGDDPHVIDSFQREDLANWRPLIHRRRRPVGPSKGERPKSGGLDQAGRAGPGLVGRLFVDALAQGQPRRPRAAFRQRRWQGQPGHRHRPAAQQRRILRPGGQAEERE